MMRYKNIMINAILIFFVTLGSGIILVYIFKHPMQELLRGIPLMVVYGTGVNLPEFFQWLWIYFPFWFIAGYYVEKAYGNRPVTLLRYGKRSRWYDSLYRDCLVLLGFWFLALCLLQLCGGYVGEFWPPVLITAHGLFIWSLEILIRELSGSGIATLTAVLMMETTGYMTGEELHLNAVFIPSSWGMYIRSNACIQRGGFSPCMVVITQVMGSIIFLKLIKMDKVRLRRGEKRND